MSSTYRVDALHPDRLVCETCGEAVAAVPAGLPADSGLTKRQLAPGFPELADVLAEHDVLCAWRRSPPGAVYVHLLPRGDGT
jgi:hypothetical protein